MCVFIVAVFSYERVPLALATQIVVYHRDIQYLSVISIPQYYNTNWTNIPIEFYNLLDSFFSLTFTPPIREVFKS